MPTIYFTEGELDLEAQLSTGNPLLTTKSGPKSTNTHMPRQGTSQTRPSETDSASITEAEEVGAYPPPEERNMLRLRRSEPHNTAIMNTLTVTDSKFINSIVNIWPSGNTNSIDVSVHVVTICIAMCTVHSCIIGASIIQCTYMCLLYIVLLYISINMHLCTSLCSYGAYICTSILRCTPL